MINYFGQGALALRNPAALKNPFYLLAPGGLLAPLVVLATAATVIASQATISGAFSVTQQAARLGYLPRVTTRHTSATERGQIYVPAVNWTMLVLVILVVLGFGSSGAIASAYGIAVSGTMVLTTALIAIVTLSRRKRANPLFLALLGLIGAAELVFFAANATKFADGGWFPHRLRARVVRGADHLEARRDRDRCAPGGEARAARSLRRRSAARTCRACPAPRSTSRPTPRRCPA